MQISRKRFELQTWYQLPTNRKWPMADRMMTSSMTSRDPERSKSWPSLELYWLTGTPVGSGHDITTRWAGSATVPVSSRSHTVNWPSPSRANLLPPPPSYQTVTQSGLYDLPKHFTTSTVSYLSTYLFGKSRVATLTAENNYATKSPLVTMGCSTFTPNCPFPSTISIII